MLDVRNITSPEIRSRIMRGARKGLILFPKELSIRASSPTAKS
jgi:hypothetical protein